MRRPHLAALLTAALFCLAAWAQEAAPAGDAPAAAAPAADAASAALDEAPPAALAAIYDGQAALYAGDADEALRLAAEARAVGRDLPPAQVAGWLLEAQAQYQRGALTEAIAAAARTIELTTVPAGQPDWPQRPEAWLLLADARRAAGQYESAREAYANLRSQAPHSLQRLLGDQTLIELDLEQRRLPEAAAGVDAYLKDFHAEPESPHLLVTLAEAYLAAGQPAEALARLAQLQADYPGSEPAWAARRTQVEAHLAAGDRAAALALVDQLTDDHPEMPAVAEATALKAALLAGGDEQTPGDPAAAVALLTDVASRYPGTFVAVRLGLQAAEHLAAADDLAGARARLETLAAEYPATYWQLSIVPPLIEVLMAQEDWDPAEDLADALAQSVEGTPNGAVYWLKKAHIQHLADRNLAADRTLALMAGRYKGAPYVTLALQQRAVLAALTAPPAAPNEP